MLQERDKVILAIILFGVFIMVAFGGGWVLASYMDKKPDVTPPTHTPTSSLTTTPTPTSTPTNTPTPTLTPTPTNTPPAPVNLPTQSLNRLLNPHHGSRTLSTGFNPDPHQAAVTSGGAVNVAGLNYGGECRGSAAESPDYEIIWNGSAAQLRIFFAAEFAGQDATIIVQDPNNIWRCNDNFEGRNPGLVISNPVQGRYDIWVGSANSWEFLNGRLTVTTRSDVVPSNADNPPIIVTPTTPAPVIPVLGHSLTPTYGSVNLSSLFTHHTARVRSGGDVNVSSHNYGSGCVGHAAEAPDYALNWYGVVGEMAVAFAADNSNSDATLIIRDPFGRYFCNDDAFGFDPALSILNPSQGTYHIWVGSLSANTFIDGILTIYEPVEPTPTVTNPAPLSLDPYQTPLYGLTYLSPGFFPDPNDVFAASDDEVDVSFSNIGADCYGFTTVAPTYRLEWSGFTGELSFYFTEANGRDATLIIFDPSGNWRCNDDYDGRNPAIVFQDPSDGLYDIWVASYSSDYIVSGILSVSEFGPFE